MLLFFWPVRCVEQQTKIYSRSPPLSLVASNITATLARGDPQNVCVFPLCDEARSVSQLCSCVQLDGEIVSPNLSFA